MSTRSSASSIRSCIRPIAGVMSEYIVGLKEYAATLQAAAKAHPDDFLDLNQYPLPGVEVVDDTTYRITIYGKYPQFAYWLAMPFFLADAAGGGAFLCAARHARTQPFAGLVAGGQRAVLPVGERPEPAHGADAQPVLRQRKLSGRRRAGRRAGRVAGRCGQAVAADRPHRVLAGKRNHSVLEQIPAGLLRCLRHQFGQLRPGGAGRRERRSQCQRRHESAGHHAFHFGCHFHHVYRLQLAGSGGGWKF